MYSEQSAARFGTGSAVDEQCAVHAVLVAEGSSDLAEHSDRPRENQKSLE